MKTEIIEQNDLITVNLEGEFDTAAAAEVDEMFRALIEKDKDIDVECAKLEYIASSGLRILLAILKRTKAAGHKLTLRNLNGDIVSVFKMTGFVDLFDIQ